MATRAYTVVQHGHDGIAFLYKWTGLAASDDGAWLHIPINADKSVHVLGTFGGTVTIQGTNEDGTPTDPQTLSDPAGTALTFTASGLRSILQPCKQIRPLAGAGVGSVTVYLLCVRSV